MINRIVLVGRLTKDPELRSTGSGVSVGTFTLAVNRQFTSANGEREADFINCVIWRKAAESFATYTHKGSQVAIDGRLQTRTYDKDDGTKVYVTEVVVDNFSLLDSKNDNQSNNTTANKKATVKADKPIDDPFKDSGDTIDISSDDLPF